MSRRWAGAIWGIVLLASGAARAERPKILVLPVEGKAADVAFRQRVAQALSEGLIASGSEVVAPPTGAAALPAEGCTTAACLSGAARATGAVLLLRAAVEEEGRSYNFKLEMLDGQSAAVVAQRENRCEICTDAEALEIANAAASAIKAQALKKAPPAAPSVTPSVAAESATGVATATPGVALASGTADTGRSTARTALSWTGIGVGVAAIVAGSVLMYLNDRGTCTLSSGAKQCPDLYDTRSTGIGFAAGGVLIGAAGVWGLAF